MKPDAGNVFNNAQAYEAYVGRWGRLVAQQFIAWLDAAPHLSWLDVGAGTGGLTQIILQQASPKKVVGVDLSSEYLEFARQHVQDERVEFRVEDVANLDAEGIDFDVVVAGLVLNFLPAPEEGVKNMAQAAQEGGMVAAYVWDYSGKMDMMRHFWDAASLVDASSRALDAGLRFAICDPNNLRAAFQAANLQAVEVMPIDVPTRFENFDDYWLPFLGAQGSVSKYLHNVDKEVQHAIRDQLQKQLPTAEDGSLSLMARAWAVKGQKIR